MKASTWRTEGKRKRGRPSTTWRRTVESETTEMGFASWEEARNMPKTEMDGASAFRLHAPK